MKKKIILFFIILVSGKELGAQTRVVDSMKDWIRDHPTIDSQYILTLHRISYRSVDYDLKQAFDYYDKVSYYSDSLNFIFGKGMAQINLGVLFFNSSNFEASNKAYFKAIEYAEVCGAQRLEAVSLNNVGENFKTLRDIAKCREYTRKAIQINTKLKAWRGVAINYELLQQCDLEEKLYDSAKNNLDRGMASAQLAHDSLLLPLFYLGFGKIYAVNNRFDSAQLYFEKAISEAKHFGDPANEYAGYMAQVEYLKHIQPREKLHLLHKAMYIARESNNLDRISKSAYQLSLFYDDQKNKDSSAAFYSIYRKAADSLFSENNKRNVVIKETEWRVERQEIENVHLKELAELQNKDLSIKNGLLLAVLISLLLILAIAFFIYKSIQNRKRNTESELKQHIIETQMQVLRSQMNPHFIFNSLNSIDAFIQSNDKYNASIYLNKFAKLVRNVLDSSKENLVSFSKDIETLKLYIELEEQRSAHKFVTELEIDPELMESDYKVPPLIIQPFIENAIIHGLRNKETNDGVLSVSISKTEKDIVYSITDNGIGRAAAAALKKNKLKSYGIEMSFERIKLFNKEAEASVLITDLYTSGGKPGGTNVRVLLNIC